jgi:hypothetical protein
VGAVASQLPRDAIADAVQRLDELDVADLTECLEILRPPD